MPDADHGAPVAETADVHDAVRAFFAPAVTKAERSDIAERYGVTKVLILDWQFVLLGELTELLGEPLSRDRTYALFDAKALRK